MHKTRRVAPNKEPPYSTKPPPGISGTRPQLITKLIRIEIMLFLGRRVWFQSFYLYLDRNRQSAKHES